MFDLSPRFSAGLRTKCLAVLAMGALSSGSLAAVPNVFTDGTSAVASEVNANFSDLDTRLAALENANVATVNVDCGTDADALGDAVASAPAIGLKINVKGTCNGFEILNKKNITIDGTGFGGTTTVISNGNRPIDIGISQGIFLMNLTADAQNTEDEAIVVGASLAVLENVTAVNGNDTAVGVYTGAIAVFTGTSSVGDGDDPRGMSIHENSGVTVEEGTLTVAAGIELRLQSSFNQHSGGGSGQVNVTGNIVATGGSYVELENGSTQTIVLSDSSLVGAPETGQNLNVSGVHFILNSVFHLLNGQGGTTTLSSLLLLAEHGSNVVVNGTADFGNPTELAIPAIATLATNWNVSKGVTVREGSQLAIGSHNYDTGGNRTATLSDAAATYEVDGFSTLKTSVTIAEANVTCVDPSKVIAQDISGASGVNPDDLCTTSDDVP